MEQTTPLEVIIKIFDYKVSKKPSDEIELLKTLKGEIPYYIKSFRKIKQKISLEKAIKESEEFMKFHFKLSSINYAEIINNSIIVRQAIIDPYEIPIEKTSDPISYTEMFFRYLKEYPERLYIKIKIQEDFSEFTPCTVTHEITHTQQEQKQGIVNDYTNIEVLPIFLEMLHYIEKSSVIGKRVILKRLASLADDISFLEIEILKSSLFNFDTTGSHNNLNEADIIAVNTYIESTLKALNLSEIYQTSNEKVRKEIISYIQEIFYGNRSVEEFLEYYDTTFDSSINQLQKKLKRMNF